MIPPASIEIFLPVVKKILIDPVVVGGLVVDLPDRDIIEAEDVGFGAGEQDRRMGSDDELDLSTRRKFPEHLEKGYLHPRRESILRFVEQIQSPYPETV